MNKGIKTALCIICASLSLALTSCGGPKLDEVKDHVAATVEKSIELNEIFYGEGLPVFTEMIRATITTLLIPKKANTIPSTS